MKSNLNRYNNKVIGEVFSISVYSPRWKHDQSIEFKLIHKGWRIQFVSFKGISTPDGSKTLYRILRSDNIEYPTSLPVILSNLWKKSHLENLNKKQMDYAFKRIGVWINKVNHSEPHFNLRKRTKV